MTDLNLDGMAIAPGVVETIVSIAVNEVDGVASVGSGSGGGLRGMFSGKASTQGAGIEISTDEEDRLCIAVRIEVYYGNVLPDLAAQVRSAVADAVTSQVGMQVASVDVYVDGIRFAGK